MKAPTNTKQLVLLMLGLLLSAPVALATDEHDHAAVHHRAGPLMPPANEAEPSAHGHRGEHHDPTGPTGPADEGRGDHEDHEQHDVHDEHGHDEDAGAGHANEHDEHGHDEESVVELTAAQMEMAGIHVEVLRLTPVSSETIAPGEVALNAYRTSQVTPRIEAQVLARKARLGDSVEPGQPLVTLSSVALAEAQGQLVVAAREWQRVERLGRKVVSEQRFIEARVAWRQARSRLLAYGLGEAEVDRLTRKGGDTEADGRFELVAPQAGTVIRDDFVTGQMVEPGRVLFVITDESRLWVEARVNPLQARAIRVGTPARIGDEGVWRDGAVVQIHHTLDERTRTLGVRIAVPNPGDHLHPGQFVEARIQLDGTGEQRLTLPTTAVLRSPDGDWQVFVEQSPGRFEAKEVELVRRLPERVVIDGLAPGTRVVTDGAFFVQSEFAKSGFDPHNH